jgi:hypothetical protein
MNIEDKYKAHFKKRKVELNPRLWSEISTRMETKQKNSHIWWLAASIVVGLLFFNHNINTIDEKSVAEIKVKKDQQIETTKTIPVSTNSSKPIVKNPLIEKTERRIKDQVVLLNTIAINKINRNLKTANLKQTKTTFVQFNLKPNRKTKLQNENYNNPVEKLIAYSKKLLKSKNVQIPIIEIDYKSILTLNKES